MSEMADDFRDYRQAQQKRRSDRLPKRQAEIEELASEGYEVIKLTEYQYRINKSYDLYPIHNRWHDLITGKRGGAKSLAQFIRDEIPLT